MKQTLNFISKLAFFLIFFVAAQQLNAQKVFIESGFLNPKRVGKQTSETYFEAVRLGGLYEHELKYNFGLQSGLLFTTSYSHKLQLHAELSDTIKYSTWAHGLDIPLRVVYNQPIYKSFRLFGFAGPNFQIGLVQNQNIKSYLSEEMQAIHNIQSGKYKLHTDQINRFNFQLGAGGGVQWRQFIVKGGYDWGLNNLDKTKNDKWLTQSNWYVSFMIQLK